MLHAIPAQNPRNTAAVLEHSWSTAPPPGATKRAYSHWTQFIRAVSTVVGAITLLVGVDPEGWVSTVGQEEAGQGPGNISAQTFILVLAVGTGAKAIAHPMGRDAVPSIMAQEACPVGQCHTKLILWYSGRTSKDSGHSEQGGEHEQQEQQEEPEAGSAA